MAIHPDTASMLKESTQEMLFVTDYCIKYRKDFTWGYNQTGGCLGYPAAIMLFSIVDTIGAFHERDKSFKIPIEGENKTINSNGFEHFYILNSYYYNQNLTETLIGKIYKNFRNLLVHNLSLPPDHFLDIGTLNSKVFELRSDTKGKQYPFINLVPFLEISKKAVARFIADVDSVVPTSNQQTRISSKIF